MQYKKLMEQYAILENDGSGPFSKDVEIIIIHYGFGKPVAILGSAENIQNPTIYGGAKLRIETDSSELVKIVKFLNQK